MPEPELISAKLEDYLAAIHTLAVRNRVARVSDIAQSMGVQMPTVTGALRHLAEHGLVNYEPYQFVTLTEQGAEIARGMIRRHDVLKKFLVDVLRLPEETGERDACGMEHALSEHSLRHLVRFLEFIETCPRAGHGLIDRFRRACAPELGDSAKCEACVEACLRRVEGQGSGVPDEPPADAAKETEP